MNNSPRFNPDARADVCLLLEGTYPYIRGGVSSWIHQLIVGMPGLSFSVLYLGGSPDEHTDLVYELPSNVVHLETHYLLTDSRPSLGDADVAKSRPTRSDASQRSVPENHTINDHLHTRLRDCQQCLDPSVLREFATLMTGPAAISQQELNESVYAWDTIREKYRNAPPGLDFNHFFWTVRGMHAPLFTLSAIVEKAPKADLYHSVSTGYAGFLGALMAAVTARPLIISEHGIYTKEREIDLAQVDWIPKQADPFNVGLDDDMGYLRQVWVRFFASLGRMAYSAADQVFSLYEGNRVRQIADGAPEEKLRIIPNGINVERYRPVRRADATPVPSVLALVGRVVPIKDIKTFVRAMRIIRTTLPEAEGWIIGPQDEDPDYTQECLDLVNSLDLGDAVKFLGFQKPEQFFPQVGLNVLTSVSEGQPLVILEGFAAGVPAITTDVGSCRELIEGAGDEDKQLGSAGLVVNMADPGAFAEAAITLLDNQQDWQRASRAAIQRVEKYYDETDMIARYAEVYRDVSSRYALSKAS